MSNFILQDFYQVKFIETKISNKSSKNVAVKRPTLNLARQNLPKLLQKGDKSLTHFILQVFARFYKLFFLYSVKLS